ncbi:MAG: YihY/virulence factor BrkB family protein [Gammaproteobacteria bacterium]|nr:YihY/virulence factor BrkB family protein [Gammaproteobacteria bacterium]
MQQKIDQVIWRPTPKGWGLPGRVLFIVLRYLYAVLRDMFSGQLTLRAMSLVYTTLLSVVPLIAFSFSVLKGFGKHKVLEQQMYLFLEPLGEKGVEITDNIMRLVYTVNSGVLGGISLAFFIYTAVTMVQKVEESFNYVWYVAKSRSFARRFTEYVFVLLIGPLAIVIALGIIGSLQNDAFVQFLLTSDVFGPVFVAVSKLVPYLLVSAAFAFLYWFIPNTKVHASSASVGGLVGGVLWATIGVIVATFVVNAARTQAVYGGFAIAISALIWLYLNWMVLLVGSQLAYYHQNPAYLRHGRREPKLSNSARERLALNIMLLVGRAFRNPESTTTMTDLSTAMKLPSLALAPIVSALEDNGLLTSTEKEEFVPGRDTAHIKLVDILAVVREHGETGSLRQPRWSQEIQVLGSKLDAAASSTVDGMTLADLLDESPG